MVSHTDVVQAFSSRILQLIIFPTEQCNFRCDYCYEDFAIGRMPPAVIEGIKKLVLSRGDDLGCLKILWFGGEPTVALNTVLDLSRFFHEFCATRDIAYSAHMTTNGYRLTPKNFAALVALGIDDFQITLDGDRQDHNTTRKLANGAGTFDVILSNLRAMKASQHTYNVTLRVHVSTSNASRIGNFISMLDREFLIDPRFSLNIHPVEPLSRDPAKNSQALDRATSGSVVKELYALVGNYKPGGPAYGEPGYICYAAQPNSFAIRANGRLAKCTVALNAPANDIGYLSENGELIVDDERHAKWFRGWQDMDSQFLTCPAGKIM
jgi:uncharacterized protein